MLSKKQKAAHLAAGAASTAAIIWLRYAKSAAGARDFLANTGAKAGRALGSIGSALATVQQRLEETDRLVHDFVQLGSEQKDRVEVVLNDTWERLEQTRDLVLNNVELSSKEISALLGDIRAAFKQLAAAKSTLAA
jgi:hypothetical protein